MVLKNRAQSLTEINDIHSYFAGDMMIDKVRDTVSKLKELGDTVKADDIEGRLKTIKEDAIRQLKDKKELFDDANTIKFGQHKFSVNNQNLDLTVVQKDDSQYFHLTGTKFFEEIDLPDFLETKDVWTMDCVSENLEVYRAEYLAYKMFNEIINDKTELSIEQLLELPAEKFSETGTDFHGPSLCRELYKRYSRL